MGEFTRARKVRMRRKSFVGFRIVISLFSFLDFVSFLFVILYNIYVQFLILLTDWDLEDFEYIC